MITEATIAIGSRDRNFTRVQYTEHYWDYINSNSEGLRGGRTPIERATKVKERLLPNGGKIFEIGPGGGHDLKALSNLGLQVMAGDNVLPFVNHVKNLGYPAIEYDARFNNIPEGINCAYAHISAFIHMPPIEAATLLTRLSERLDPPKGIFLSVIKDFGHRRENRTGFPRDFYYYTSGRLIQLLHQQGVAVKFFETVPAFNETVTIHAGGLFREEERQKPAYGEFGIQPFGDVYWSTNVLYEDSNLIHDLIYDQIKVGLCKEETPVEVAKYKSLFHRRLINFDEQAREINKVWAANMAEKNIAHVMQHAHDFFNEKPRFRSLVLAALAVCNNNGFGSYLIGPEPSWLMEVITQHLNPLRRINGGAEWTTTADQFTGTLTGAIYYPGLNKDSGRLVQAHQKSLMRYLDSKYKRVTIGITDEDTEFIKETDYPIIAFPGSLSVTKAAIEQGLFTDANGQILVDSIDRLPWVRWQVIKDEPTLVRYLYTVTADLNPVRPASDYPGEELFWKYPQTVVDPKRNLAYRSAIIL